MNSFLLIYHPVFNFGVFWVTGLYQTNQEKTINIIGVVAVFIFIVDIIIFFGGHVDTGDPIRDIGVGDIGVRDIGVGETIDIVINDIETNLSETMVYGFMIMYIFTDLIIITCAFQYRNIKQKRK